MAPRRADTGEPVAVYPCRERTHLIFSGLVYVRAYAGSFENENCSDFVKKK